MSTITRIFGEVVACLVGGPVVLVLAVYLVLTGGAQLLRGLMAERT